MIRNGPSPKKAPLLESHRRVAVDEPIGQSSSITASEESWIQSILSQQEMLFWCIYWFVTNLTITFYNKHVLSSLNASPLVNTFVHLSYTFTGCLIIERGSFPSLTQSELSRMALYSFIFSLNIVWCQWSIKLTTLSLNQVCRAMTPLFQATFSYFLAGQTHSCYTLVPLIPVCLGVAMTATSELNLGIIALISSISSVVVSALKGVLSMKILQQDLKTKLQEYSFLVIVTPMAAVWTLLLNFLFFLYESGETEANEPDEAFVYSLRNIVLLSIGGIMALAVNIASIGTVKRTSATSMGVMANSKQAVTIFGAMIFAEGNWTNGKLLGVIVTLFGASLYSYRKEMERQQRSKLMPLPK